MSSLTSLMRASVASPCGTCAKRSFRARVRAAASQSSITASPALSQAVTPWQSISSALSPAVRSMAASPS